MFQTFSHLNQKRVFIIDEEYDFRNLLGYYLQQKGCDVHVFPNVKSAQTSDLGSPDVVIVHRRSSFEPGLLESVYKDAIILESAPAQRADPGQGVSPTFLIYAAVIILLAILLFGYFSNRG